jgi:CRP-like cAMP-binding protein
MSESPGSPLEPAACPPPGVLRSRGWLSEPPEGLRSAVSRKLRVRRFEAGERICAVGDPPRGLYGVVEGNVSLEVAERSGRVPVHGLRRVAAGGPLAATAPSARADGSR